MPQKVVPATLVLTTDLHILLVTVPIAENVTIAKKDMYNETGRVDLVGEDETNGTLVLFEPIKGGENTRRGRTFVEGEEPLPLNSFHPNVSDWIIQ